jgi:hypothetical protein
MTCKVCGKDVMTESTIAHKHIAVKCLNPQCKRYMIKHYVKVPESEKTQ